MDSERLIAPGIIGRKEFARKKIIIDPKAYFLLTDDTLFEQRTAVKSQVAYLVNLTAMYISKIFPSVSKTYIAVAKPSRIGQ